MILASGVVHLIITTNVIFLVGILVQHIVSIIEQTKNIQRMNLRIHPLKTIRNIMKRLILVIFIVLAQNIIVFAQLDQRYTMKELWPKAVKARAYTYPAGTTKIANLIGNDSKPYKFITSVFNQKTRFFVVQSKHLVKDNTHINHIIGGYDCQKGSMGLFELNIGKEKNGDVKIFISFPGVSIGKLNFDKKNNGITKYKLFKKEEQRKGSIIPSVLIYEDNTNGDIEKKYRNLKELSVLQKSEFEKEFYSEIGDYYLIYYSYNTKK